MTDIHPTAIISPGARIGEGVRIGPYSIVESDCEIGDDCWIDAHVKIARYTSLGPRCRVYLGALVGEEPQDHRFKPGTVAHTVIGSDTTIREYVTIHRSPFEGGITSVGDRTLLMAFVHLGHDVRVGNRVTIANQTGISGHVIIEDGAVLSGYVLIHQFCQQRTVQSDNGSVLAQFTAMPLITQHGSLFRPSGSIPFHQRLSQAVPVQICFTKQGNIK